jgi:hypothetical protein
MAEPVRVASPAPPSSARYRPLSALAMIAFATALVYAIVVGGLGLVAFITGKTLFLRLWVLIFPVAAVVCAVVAQRQIRRSEGTLSGGALATGAWWLALVFGLGFLAFYAATYLAVWTQAKNFSELWLNKLSEGKVVDALLLTQEPAQRKFDNPENKQALQVKYGLMPVGARKGPLGAFEDREVVRIFQEAGGNTQIQAFGVKNWDYDKGGYKVWQTYRVGTPLGAWDVQVTVQSSESPEFEGRQWFVALNDVGVTASALSPLGGVVDLLRKQVRTFVRDWLIKLENNDLEGAFLDTCDPHERAAIQRKFYLRRAAHRVAASAGAAATSGLGIGSAGEVAALTSMASPQLECLEYLDGCQKLLSGGILEADKLEVLQKYHDDVVKNVTQQCDYVPGLDVDLQDSLARFHPMEQGAPGPIELSHDVRIQLYPNKQEVGEPKYLIDASVRVQTDPKDLPRDLDKRFAAWRVVGIKLLRANVPMEERKSTTPAKKRAKLRDRVR